MANVESLQDVLSLIARTFAFHWGLTAALALIIYGPLRRLVRHRKLNPNPHTLRHVVVRELPWSFATLLVASGLTLAISVLGRRGIVHIDTENDVSPLRIAAEVTAYVLCYDIYFYWLHRLLHQDPWYSWIHRVHHVSSSPSVATAFVFHPVEAVVTGGFAIALFSLHDFHQISVVCIGLIGAGVGVLVHSGYDLLPEWWSRVPLLQLLVTPAFHDRHHAEENCHYGAFTVIMDRWFGTSPIPTRGPALAMARTRASSAGAMRSASPADLIERASSPQVSVTASKLMPTAPMGRGK